MRLCYPQAMLKYHRLNGAQARHYAEQLANLRLKVFWEFPYLYEGTLEYEMNYLETYFKSVTGFIFLVEDAGKIVGATTSIKASEEELSFREPFIRHGLNPDEVFYFGESVLLPEYRGRGIGKLFFQEREAFAQTLPGIKWISFCAVERPSSHPLRPEGYRPLNEFWEMMGFSLVPGLRTEYSWRDRGEDHESAKSMQFWLKELR